MISPQRIRYSIAILLIMYTCLILLQIDWPKTEHILLQTHEIERNVSLPDQKQVRVEQSNCSGPVKLLRGYRKRGQGFLTLGLCTVPRSKASYLNETLHSLIHHMTDEDKKEVVIIVFLGSHVESDINKTLTMIETNFMASLTTGVLQVVQPDISVYPNLNKIEKRTFNDPMKRVRWRTKQNLDFAYLFGYAEGFSKYYMHMEDDIDGTPNYITEIKRIVVNQEQSKHHWFVLNFGEGFYGQLLRSRDLCMLKTYLLLFQDQKPCDMLLEDLKLIQLHDFKHIKDFKGKFKHKGQYSSLDGKIVPMKKGITKHPLPVATEMLYVSNLTSNPPADIETTFKTYSNFSPQYAYMTDSTFYFWATLPMVGDYFRVKLKSQVLCSRITIRTGAPITTEDMLENASVTISSSTSGKGICIDYQTIGKLTFGKFEHKFKKPKELNCLQIVTTRKQNHWVIISQIEIET